MIQIDGTSYGIDELKIYIKMHQKLKKLLDGQTEDFRFTGKFLRTEILGDIK